MADRWTEARKEWEKRNAEARAEYKRRYYREHKETVRLHTRRNKLRRKYGITEETYQLLLSEQNGRCAICRSDTPGRGYSFRVDHCHKTGRVRGLLCHKCNAGIGMLQDDAEVVCRAAEYLKTHSD